MGAARDQSTGKSLRKKVLSYTFQAALLVIVLWGITEWQARNLLPKNSTAPAFTLDSLDGEALSSEALKGRKVVLYFFAPWCSVCNFASKNVVALRNAHDEDEVAVIAIGLGWNTRGEVERFSEEHHLNVPVLLGDDQLLRNYNINAFPTVYILDEQGVVTDRVVGYTTELGLRLRTL